MSYQSFENGTSQDSFVIVGGLIVQSEPGQASTSKISFDSGQMTSDGAGNLTFGNASVALLIEKAPAAAQVLATAGTIVTTNLGVGRETPAAAVTGVILQPGLVSGQAFTVINESIAASSITFAVAGTSNVADGAGSALAGLTARRFVWDQSTLLWYRTA